MAWTLAIALLAAALGASASPLTRGSRAFAQATHTVSLWPSAAAHAAATCDSALQKVSNPDNAEFYGKHWSFSSMKQFHDAEHTRAVRQWVISKDLSFVEAPNHEFITIKDTVSKIEAAFNAEIYEYSFSANAGRASFLAAELPRAGLPAEIASHVDVHTGLDRLPKETPRALAALKRVSGLRQSGVATPQVIFQTYKIQNRTIADIKASNNIFASLGQSFSPSDLTAFQDHYNLPHTPVSHVIGPNSPSSCSANPNNCVEAELDTQQITAIAQGTNTSFWSIPASVTDIFSAWIEAVAASGDPPKVHSVSYGSLAPEDPKPDMSRFNLEVCKMGLRGLTVMVASGDDGVANFEARSDKSQCGFTPSFPATSPYVTAVGATQGPESGSTEIACTSDTGGGITSGGGFSLFFKMPSYQEAAVQKYLSMGASVDLPPTNLFASGGRAYPDVSSMGHNFPISINGNIYEGSGTSASSPCFAGIVTLVNGLRLAAGKSPLGFLNPAIYGKLLGTPAFNDITSGRNNCCAGAPGSAVCCQYGFNATQGWDPITGAGSVNYPEFSKMLVAM